VLKIYLITKRFGQIKIALVLNKTESRLAKFIYSIEKKNVTHFKLHVTFL